MKWNCFELPSSTVFEQRQACAAVAVDCCRLLIVVSFRTAFVAAACCCGRYKKNLTRARHVHCCAQNWTAQPVRQRNSTQLQATPGTVHAVSCVRSLCAHTLALTYAMRARLGGLGLCVYCGWCSICSLWVKRSFSHSLMRSYVEDDC